MGRRGESKEERNGIERSERWTNEQSRQEERKTRRQDGRKKERREGRKKRREKGKKNGWQTWVTEGKRRPTMKEYEARWRNTSEMTKFKQRAGSCTRTLQR